MAGKRIKCPKCGQPLKIGGAAPAPSPETQKWGSGATSQNSVMDLLDEAGVQHARTGPVCPECNADIEPDAVICVQCGFNMELGRRMDTLGDEDDIDGLTETEKIMRKAEQEIDDMPISAEGQDYGDGPESFILAIVALVAMVSLAGIAVGTIYFLDVTVGESINPAQISFWVGLLMIVVGFVWNVIIAFMDHPVKGIIALFFFPYAIIYGIMNFAALWAPTASFLMGMIVSGLCYWYLVASA